MTDQDNLRDRLSDVIDRALSAWMTVDDALDGTDEGSEEDFVAQAIIDDLGLTVERSMVSHRVHNDGTWTTWPSQTRAVGKWEAEE